MKNPDNHLHQETSPYLLQHADNPVNWYPWNSLALELAKTENKPILLSIGYSACHWCHVMAHESFEDEDTARIMNEHFINIKVDREERPDLDKIYQTAHSLLTSRPGGWPLTVFLSPENQMPFFAGTYFPDERRFNMPSFREIMFMVSDAYTKRKHEIEKQDDSISGVLQNISSHTPNNDTLSTLPLDLARKQLGSAFDRINGGFSKAPKFPHASMLERCIRHYLFLRSQEKQDTQAFEMAIFSINRMAMGGFQDQLGGGFFRYSTDDNWMIPHFEKMLYDNAQLFALYSQAFALTHNDFYKKTVLRAAEWLLREMQTDEGGYCSALDADTDKVEGKTYIWQPQEVRSLLTEEEYPLFARKFGLDEPANFEGNWHLHSQLDNLQLSAFFNLSVTQVDQLLDSSIEKLLLHRNQRTQPGRDDKILCAWNALMIRGMSMAGRYCNRADFIDSAFASSEFIRNTLWKDNRLLASYKDGKAHLNAYLDDYAFLLQAVLELLQAEWRNDYFTWARDLANSLLEHFEDTDQGGFFFTSHDHEQLLYRSKTFADDAMPNGNGVAASALLQLGLLSGNTDYIDAAERCIRCAYNDLSEQAISHCSILHALELYLKPGVIIILRGKQIQLEDWKQLIDCRYIPHIYYAAIDNNCEPPAELIDKKPVGDICAYICEGTHCLPAITDRDAFENYLSGLTFNENS